MNTIIEFLKKNILIAILGLLVVIYMLFPKMFRGVFSPQRKRRRRATRKPIIRKVSSSKPRSRVSRTGGAGYAAAGGGTIPYKYNKDGTVKKAWQVGGTLAAKQRMSRLRKKK